MSSGTVRTNQADEDYQLVHRYISRHTFKKNPIFLVSLRQLRKEEEMFGEPIKPRYGIRSTIGGKGSVPEQTIFWKPWTRSGKLAIQVLRDIQRDSPEEMTYIDHWSGDHKQFKGVTLKDAGRALGSWGLLIGFMTAYGLMLFSMAGLVG